MRLGSWLIATHRRISASSCDRRPFVELAANGAFSRKSSNDRQLTKQLGGLIALIPICGKHVYGLLKDGAKGLAILAGRPTPSPSREHHGGLAQHRNGDRCEHQQCGT